MRSYNWLACVFSLLLTDTSTQSTAVGIDVNVANVPDCAKVCLSNSTQYATDCAQIDVKCLCNSPNYVSALSCCLATNCNAADQQTAIQFNIQECAAVNSTAPNFVGCSPFSLTTGGANRQTTATASASGNGNTGAITISENGVTLPTAYSNNRIATASYAGASLLTGTCSVPMFAQVTNPAGTVIQFPQVGCASNRGSCCPFDPNEYAGITKCPADYTSTAGGCCPRYSQCSPEGSFANEVSGYSVYNSAVGIETPCFSKLSRAYLPASTATGSQISVVTDTVFSRRYTLVRSSNSDLSGGAIAGIVLGASVCAVGLPGLIVFFLRRYRRKQEALIKQTDNPDLAFPSTNPALGSHHQMIEIPAGRMLQSPQELASPEAGVSTPTTMKGLPFPSPSTGSGLPAYEMSSSSTRSFPAEMPGSTHIHEHHPAYYGNQSQTSLQLPPRSPPDTMGTRSPVLSPPSPYRTDSPSNVGTITPLGSPSLRGSSPRFREGTM